MTDIKKILFPVDFTDNQLQLLPLLKTLVKQHQASLVLLTVIEDLDHYANFYIPHPDLRKMVADARVGAERKLGEYAEQHLYGVEGVSLAVVDGDAAPSIVKYAQENGVDLIVMHTHGRKGLEHAIFGSVAEGVVRASRVPVLTWNPVKG